MHSNYKRYNASVLVLSLMLFFLAVLAIIKTTDGYKSSDPIIQKAANWQSRTKGVASMSTKLSTKFKHLTGTNYINKGSINTVIFGASTVMGIRSNMFSKPYQTYNFALNSNRLFGAIGQIGYFLKSNDNIKWVIVGIDYSLGAAFTKDKISKFQPNGTFEEISLIEIVKDAVVLDRLKISMRNLWRNIVEDNMAYACPENDGIGMDFGTTREPGHCDGFRYDGSATFRYRRLTEVKWRNGLSDTGLKRYTDNLIHASGEVNREYLLELAKIDRLLKDRSGRLIVLLPPLMPGAEKFILASPAGVHLRRFKTDMSEWSRKNDVSLLDAGQSEGFGCRYSEFFDKHHALDHCYRRVFERFPRYENNEEPGQQAEEPGRTRKKNPDSHDVSQVT